MSLLPLIKNFFKLNFYKKHRYFIFLVLPCISIVALFSIFSLSGNTNTEIKAGIIFKDQDPLALAAADHLSGLPGHLFLPYEEDESTVKEHILNEDFDLIVIMPQNLTSRLLNGEKPEIEISSIKQLSAIFVKNELDSFFSLAAGTALLQGQTAEGLYAVLSEVDSTRFTFSYQAEGAGAEASDEGDRIIGFLLLFVFAQAMTATRLIMKDKEGGTYNRIRTAPVSELAYTLANLISGYLLVTAQIALSMTIVYIVLPIELAISPLKLFLLLSAFSFASLSIGLLLTGISRTTEQANNLATVILTPASMLGGCFWPIFLMPNIMQKIAYITPQYWTMSGLDLLRKNDPSALFSFLILAVMGVFFTALYWIIIKRKNADSVI